MDDEPFDYSRFNCLDCNIETGIIGEYYMLLDHIWKQINPAIDGMLCIGCAEKRLGRPLYREDFADVPLNKMKETSGSVRLRVRLMF